MDVELPPSFAKHFRGPKFGIAGCRQLAGVQNRPLIGTIIKPSIGMAPQQTAELVKTLAEAGIDFVKDDELMADPPHSPFDERWTCHHARHQHPHRSHRQEGDAITFNVSDELDDIAAALRENRQSRAATLRDDFALDSVGLRGAKKICDLGALAIRRPSQWLGHVEPPSAARQSSFPPYQKTLAARRHGPDPHVNGIANKFWESDDSVVEFHGSVCKATARRHVGAAGRFLRPVGWPGV